MKIFWIFLLVPLCHNGIPFAEGTKAQDSTSSTQDKNVPMQLNLMKGLAEKFKKTFSFPSDQQIYRNLDKIVSTLNEYNAKAQMSLLENLGDLIISQNENIKNLVNFVTKSISKMNIDEVDGQKSLLENLHNMVGSLSGNESIQNLQGLLREATTSYDELVQTNLEKTRNSYLSSNSNKLPPCRIVEELSNMITVHGSFDTNNDVISVLRQLVESGNKDDVKLETENDHRQKINGTLENAKILFNKMVEDRINKVAKSSNEQQHSMLEDLSNVISKMENLERRTQISALETLFTLVQEEYADLNAYNHQFKQKNTTYNESVKEELQQIMEKYFTLQAGVFKYTPLDDKMFQQIAILISKINDPNVNDTILATLLQPDDLPPQDEETRNELIRKVETLNNDVIMMKLKEISEQYARNLENIGNSLLQKLELMTENIGIFDEATKQNFVGVFQQVANAGRQDIKNSKRFIKKATTFVKTWIVIRIKEMNEKYRATQTDLSTDDETFHQLDKMMSPYNEVKPSLAIVRLLEFMTNLNHNAKLFRNRLLEKAKTYYNQSAATRLHELLKKRDSEPPQLISSKDEMFGELENLITDVNDMKLNEQILKALDDMKINEEDRAAEDKHEELTQKVINVIDKWISKRLNEIEKDFYENKQSAPLLPKDPIFNDLDMVITEVTEPRNTFKISEMINQMVDSALLEGDEEIVKKCTELKIKNWAFHNLYAQRQLKQVIKQIRKQHDIPPDDNVFLQLSDLIGGMPTFLISTIELIFHALNSLSNMNTASREQRDKLLQSVNTEYKDWVKTRLESYAGLYKDQPKMEYLESINDMITDFNDVEVCSIILQHLHEMTCGEKEENDKRDELIQKVENAADLTIREELRFVMTPFLYPHYMENRHENVEIREIDELISHMKFLHYKTQEFIIIALLQPVMVYLRPKWSKLGVKWKDYCVSNIKSVSLQGTIPSNRDDLIMKWYNACTFAELKEEYKDIINQHLQNSRSPPEVNNLKESERSDNLHRASNDNLPENNTLQEKHNPNDSRPMESTRFSKTDDRIQSPDDITSSSQINENTPQDSPRDSNLRHESNDHFQESNVVSE